MKLRNAFTMIELIFVIVIMGIIGKFGVEFLVRAYDSFILSSVNNTLQSNSAAAVEFIASRLQNRIKDSVIVRTDASSASYTALASADPTVTYTVLEWISSDSDGFRGTNTPLWSGILDLDAGILLGNNTLVSPATDTTAISTLINTLSYGTTTIDNAALYFIGSNNDINGFGWDGVALTSQANVMHPIKAVVGEPTQFTSSIVGQTFAGVDVYEYYKLAWTANALVITYDNATKMGTLDFYYNYQPWNGQTFNNATNVKHFPLMEDVSTFQAMAIGSIMKIQVCTKSLIVKGDINDGGYSLCKEKTIY